MRPPEAGGHTGSCVAMLVVGEETAAKKESVPKAGSKLLTFASEEAVTWLVTFSAGSRRKGELEPCAPAGPLPPSSSEGKGVSVRPTARRRRWKGVRPHVG